MKQPCFRAYPSHEDPAYLVNACFADDQRPVSYWEIAIALRLLEWTRQDLLAVLSRQPIRGAQGDWLDGILSHIANAENWYFAMLEMDLDRQQWPVEPHEQIAVVRRHVRRQLPGLIGETLVRTHYGEDWTARKIIRRMLWHERDHTQQIAGLLGAYDNG